MNDANTRAERPQTTVVPNTNNRCHCGAAADGVDARSRQPVCSDCADTQYSGKQFICDGGTSWFDLSGFERDLLVEIYQMDQPSGQAIRRRFEAVHGETINHGRLYPNLDDLVDYGLIEKGKQDQRTNYYEVTNDGRRLVEETDRRFDRATTEPLAAATDGGDRDE